MLESWYTVLGRWKYSVLISLQVNGNQAELIFLQGLCGYQTLANLTDPLAET